MHKIIRSCFVALTLFSTGLVCAQDFPQRPLRVVVPFPPGGPTDWLGRAVSDQLSRRLGQPVIAENRPGAGGYTGADVVSRTDPDGYTLLLGANNLVTFSIFLKDNKLNPLKSFEPLTMVMQTPWIIVTPTTVPARTLGEYIAHAKANPGKLNFAAVTNSAQQLDTIRFLKEAGINMVLINYNGSAPVYTALLANEVQGYFGAWSAIAPQIKAGKLVALAVASSQRLSFAPSVPTVKEAGLDFEASTWFGFFAPAGTPKARVSKLSTEIAAIVKTDLRDKIHDLGYEPVGSTPEVLTRVMERESAMYTDMAAAIGVKPQ